MKLFDTYHTIIIKCTPLPFTKVVVNQLTTVHTLCVVDSGAIVTNHAELNTTSGRLQRQTD